MDIKEIRQSLAMSQSEFAKYFEIPAGTIRNWEQGIRKAPPYVCSLIERLVETGEGHDNMCKQMEDRINEEIMERTKKIIVNLWNNKVDKETIAKSLELSLNEVEHIIEINFGNVKK